MKMNIIGFFIWCDLRGKLSSHQTSKKHWCTWWMWNSPYCLFSWDSEVLYIDLFCSVGLPVAHCFCPPARPLWPLWWSIDTVSCRLSRSFHQLLNHGFSRTPRNQGNLDRAISQLKALLHCFVDRCVCPWLLCARSPLWDRQLWLMLISLQEIWAFISFSEL